MSIAILKNSLNALNVQARELAGSWQESDKQFISAIHDAVEEAERGQKDLSDCQTRIERLQERIKGLEDTCYALLGKLQVANLKLAFKDLRPELEHHAARILNEEFGEKK